MVRALFYNVQLLVPGYVDHIRAHKLRSFLIKGSWDIVALCEVYVPSLKNILLNDELLNDIYPYRIIDLDKPKDQLYPFSGLVILSKYEILSKKRIEFSEQIQTLVPRLSNFRTKREILFAEINIDNQPVGVFTTHLQFGYGSARNYSRHQQLKEIHDIVDDFWDWEKPTVILADLNVKDNGDNYQLLRHYLPFASDWWVNLYPNRLGHTLDRANTRQIFLDNTRVDYFLGNQLIKPLGMEIHKPDWSITETEWSGELSIGAKLWLAFAFIARLIDIPKAILIELDRVRRGLPRRLFTDHDLSDHYPIEAEFKVQSHFQSG